MLSFFFSFRRFLANFLRLDTKKEKKRKRKKKKIKTTFPFQTKKPTHKPIQSKPTQLKKPNPIQFKKKTNKKKTKT